MSLFYECFGGEHTVLGIAHGRVNLIGEHTDYNGGYVLPTVIPQATKVFIRPRDDANVKVVSANLAAGIEPYSYVLGEEAPARGWADYVMGVTRILTEQEYPVYGFEAAIESSVPMGSGLSSSAALEVALLKGLRSAFNLPISDFELAFLCQKVENDFVGAKVGIMDPMVCSLGQKGKALFVDTKSMEYQSIDLPLSQLDLVVINSGVTHSNAHGSYNQRRAECERACELLGVEQLRELTAEDMPRIEALPDPFKQRARHVVTENQRVLDAVTALREADTYRLGELFYASHLSLQNDYEVSIEEINLMIGLARSEPAVFGARITGGGFGGSVVMLTRPSTGRETAERIAAAYKKKSGRTPTVLVPV
jgi:galactokinase